MTRLTCLSIPLLAAAGTLTAYATEEPDPAQIEAGNAVIGRIVLEKANVFDLTDPDENNWLYRLANRFHIVTRDSVIEEQLLLRRGDQYSVRASDESGRLLRQNRYLYDADIRPLRVQDGVVDLVVATRDVWTLGPDISASR